MPTSSRPPVELLSELAMLGGLLPQRPIGRGPQPLAYNYVRDLELSDLPDLIDPPPLPATSERLDKLKYKHHALARYLAEGKSYVECSALTGYSTDHIASLRKVPMFAELVEYYKTQVFDIYRETHVKLSTLGSMALDELSERLAENPRTLQNRELREIAEMALDRSVAPNKSIGQAPTGNGNSRIVINFVSPPSPSAQPEGRIVDVTPSEDKE